MAYAQGTTRLIVKGVIAGTQDYSFGFAWAKANPAALPSYADLLAWVTACVTPTNTLRTAAATLFSKAVSVTTLRAEYYDGGPSAGLIAEVPVTGYTVGTTNVTQSPRASIVISSMTNQPGRSRMGRSYVPALGLTLDTSTGRLIAGNPATILGWFKPWVTSISAINLATASMTPVVASKTYGYNTPIAGLRCDDLLDTQRRRENDYQPVYTNVSYP